MVAGALGGGTERQAGCSEARPTGTRASPTAAPRTSSALLSSAEQTPSWKTSSIQINAFTCTGLPGF